MLSKVSGKLTPPNFHVGRGIDADPNAVRAGLEHGDCHTTARQNNFLLIASAENQHVSNPFSLGSGKNQEAGESSPFVLNDPAHGCPAATHVRGKSIGLSLGRDKRWSAASRLNFRVVQHMFAPVVRRQDKSKSDICYPLWF